MINTTTVTNTVIKQKTVINISEIKKIRTKKKNLQKIRSQKTRDSDYEHHYSFENQHAQTQFFAKKHISNSYHSVTANIIRLKKCLCTS